MHIETVFNNCRKKVLFLCLGRRNCIILWYHDFLIRWENLHRENWKMDVFPESLYVNSNSQDSQLLDKHYCGPFSLHLSVFIYPPPPMLQVKRLSPTNLKNPLIYWRERIAWQASTLELHLNSSSYFQGFNLNFMRLFANFPLFQENIKRL